MNQRNYLIELSLRYELNKDKQKLETYSTQLEQLVQERTKELSISEKWHRSIFDNATDGILILDRNGVVINVNGKACEITGFDKDALIGENIELIEAGKDRESYRERMTRILNSESLIYEFKHYRKDGSKVIIEASSKAVVIADETYVQCFYRDITEKKTMQEQLTHSQKMESIGLLAGGIAHNFNNTLSGILGYSQLLLEFGNLDDVSRQRVQNIENSARKAEIMVRQMMRFARREAHEVLPVNINDTVIDAVKLFQTASQKKIKLEINLDENTHIIDGDPNQIEQVIMNLLVNARDAMPEGGLITISTRLVDAHRNRYEVPPYVVLGKYIVLTITDTGTGIPQDIINKIFDPFFTTKERGKGTGLGLASAYGIIKDHKGYIEVRSDIGKETSFDVYLPVSGNISPQDAKPRNNLMKQ